MIKYNKVRIIEGNKLELDFEFEESNYYEHAGIGGVRIDSPLTYNTGTHFFPDKDYIYEGDTRHYQDVIPISGISKDLIIITPIVRAIIPPEAPCGTDVVDTRAIYNKDILNEKGLAYLKELGDTCNIPRGFIDFILKKYALDLAIDTCNYGAAVKYWKMLTMVKGTPIKGCGCNEK